MVAHALLLIPALRQADLYEFEAYRASSWTGSTEKSVSTNQKKGRKGKGIGSFII